jgi:hypothetical protein
MDLARLTHEEDGALRRLTFFQQMGMQLSPAYREVRTEIRSRDHRTVVRDPWERGVTSAH